jgi:hypothetical protein
MERLLAQGGVDFLERRVKPAKERSGGKVIAVTLQIPSLTVKACFAIVGTNECKLAKPSTGR